MYIIQQGILNIAYSELISNKRLFIFIYSNDSKTLYIMAQNTNQNSIPPFLNRNKYKV